MKAYPGPPQLSFMYIYTVHVHNYVYAYVRAHTHARAHTHTCSHSRTCTSVQSMDMHTIFSYAKQYLAYTLYMYMYIHDMHTVFG